MNQLASIADTLGVHGLRAVPFSSCTVKKQYLVDRLAFKPASVFIGVIPYYSAEAKEMKRSVSLYAVPRDYHIFAKEAADKLIPEAEKLYPGKSFAAFCDHSPIDEVRAAACAGLGIIGKNGLLITPDFSSFVFIFELLSDAEPDTVPLSAGSCENCGACLAACPAGLEKSACLSLISQKKGGLNEAEISALKKNACVWGCDVCQLVCPHTSEAEEKGTLHLVPDFFREKLLPCPDAESVENKEDFACRAYSWRGRDTILRNVEIIKDTYKEKNE